MALFERIREDVASVLERDPAARSWVEVLLCYPGLWAVWTHRVANAVFHAGERILAFQLRNHGGRQSGRHTIQSHQRGAPDQLRHIRGNTRHLFSLYLCPGKLWGSQP